MACSCGLLSAPGPFIYTRSDMTSKAGEQENPLVSVIIPAYNQGPLLARAIDSALSQIYPRVEVIVVNDGSPAPITSETAARYSGRIVYVERDKSGGVAAARNTGLEAASGDLIALLDHDDRWLPHKLEREVAALSANPGAVLVHSSYYLINEESTRTKLVSLPERRWKPLPELLLEVAISPCTTLFRRGIVEEVGGFDPALNGSDDWDLWLRMAVAGYDFYCIGEPLAEYRVHAGMTSRDDPLMVGLSFRVLDKFYGLSGLPAVALDYKDRAYFVRHAWAASVYFGLGRLEEARSHLRKAAHLYPERITTGRFLQSLVYAGGRAPTEEIAGKAVAFVLREVRTLNVPPHLRRRLRAKARLMVARHSSVGRFVRLRRVAGALLRSPQLALDPEMWGAARRLAGRLRTRVPLLRRYANNPS